MKKAHILAEGAPFFAARPFPERVEEQLSWYDRLAQWLYALMLAPLRDRLRDSPALQRNIVQLTEQHAAQFLAQTDAQLRNSVATMRGRLRHQGFSAALVSECFALIREAAQRSMNMCHHPEQIMAGWAMVQGNLIEMATGEGKTFAATLPACVIAMAGYPVHVITVNDYLARRDAQKMSPLYQLLGLSVGVIEPGMSKPERRAAYKQAITYCTNKDVAFDYLRDSMVLESRSSRLHLSLERLRGNATRDDQLVMRGLYFAIVDEADSVFIDEARTPLILSATRSQTKEQADYILALEFTKTLLLNDDYEIDTAERRILLGNSAKSKLDQYTTQNGLSGLWTSVRAREELIVQALTAVLLFQRDTHYVVSDEKVQIVDEATGRIMADRSWERGLHQLIETKEGCPLSERRETIARMTYQRLFRRYLRLAGMTGTAREVQREINEIYRLGTVRIPLHRPSKRSIGPAIVCRTLQEKWQAVAKSVQTMALERGRPVLIGTRSVKASEEISALLHAQGLSHRLLNAKQDVSEAEIIGEAGLPGCITVATNMAGRGTDITLAAGVAEKGGLHVILTEYHDSRRIDRQLFGRSARQGDPGSCQVIVSLEDELFTSYLPKITSMLRRAAQSNHWLNNQLLHNVLKTVAQFLAEKKNEQLRMQNMKHDQQLTKVLAFSGKGE